MQATHLIVEPRIALKRLRNPLIIPLHMICYNTLGCHSRGIILEWISHTGFTSQTILFVLIEQGECGISMPSKCRTEVFRELHYTLTLVILFIFRGREPTKSIDTTLIISLAFLLWLKQICASVSVGPFLEFSTIQIGVTIGV